MGRTYGRNLQGSDLEHRLPSFVFEIVLLWEYMKESNRQVLYCRKMKALQLSKIGSSLVHLLFVLSYCDGELRSHDRARENLTKNGENGKKNFVSRAWVCV